MNSLQKGGLLSNNTDSSMVIASLQVMASSSPIPDLSSSDKESIPHQLAKLEHPTSHQVFPVSLVPCEKLDLIFRLHLSAVPSDSELCLRAIVKWKHIGGQREITTMYKLPRFRVRSPPFIVTVHSEEEAILHKRFYVTYSISNQLHDFMGAKVYYTVDNLWKQFLEKGGSDEEFCKLEHLKNSVLCHDPDIQISSCPMGSCIPIHISFTIHEPGLYELSELIKVNLRYSLPEDNLSECSHMTSSADSPASLLSLQSTDDHHHLLASENLWQNRKGSTASLVSPLVSQSADEKRRTFAAKSYSFGDLGPTTSAESVDISHTKFKSVKRSSAVAPARPPPPRMLSQAERELIKPSNFLKQPFYVYIKADDS